MILLAERFYGLACWFGAERCCDAGEAVEVWAGVCGANKMSTLPPIRFCSKHIRRQQHVHALIIIIITVITHLESLCFLCSFPREF